MSAEGVTTAKRYKALESKREAFLRRAREAASLTIPTLLPPPDGQAATNIEYPNQIQGSMGVNNLANTLLLAMLPPNQPCFRHVLRGVAMDELDKDVKAELDAVLATREVRMLEELELLGVRHVLGMALKHLLVTGNCLLYLHKDGLRLYTLNQYVINRSGSGEMLEVVVKELVSPLLLPEEVCHACGIPPTKPEDEKDVEVYTYIYREADMLHSFQEIKGCQVPGSDAVYPVDQAPWMCLWWYPCQGQDYSYSYVDQYMGDLLRADVLSQVLSEGCAAAAKVVFLNDPAGVTKIKDVTGARNGEVVAGRAADIGALQVQKAMDFQTAKAELETIERRLGVVFLRHTAVQRTGERVTAEEIRWVATEVDKGMGGEYTVLSRYIIRPLIMAITLQMERDKKIAPLPKDSIKVEVITGIEALGRSQELEKLRTALALLRETIGEEETKRLLSTPKLALRVTNGLNFDLSDVIKSEEEMQAEREQEQAMQMAQLMAPQMARNAGMEEEEEEDILDIPDDEVIIE